MTKGIVFVEGALEVAIQKGQHDNVEYLVQLLFDLKRDFENGVQ